MSAASTGASASPHGRSSATDAAPLDVASLRQEFSILAQTVRGKPLVYLDNAATTQKPRAVINALVSYYERDNANVHRGVHLLVRTGDGCVRRRAASRA